MDLNTFGSLLSFAIFLEKQAEESYLRFAMEIKNTPMIDQFSGYARRYAQRRKMLEEIRQRNINEVLLEPIPNLDSGNYVFMVDINKEMDIRAVFDAALNIETKVGRFYSDALQVAGMPLGEVARVFTKLSGENEERRKTLLS